MFVVLGSGRPHDSTGKPRGPATTTRRLILAVFKEDGDKVLDLIGRDALTELKADDDLRLIGVMTDELRGEIDVAHVPGEENCADIVTKSEEWGLPPMVA
jgi:hypothetical protein